MFFGEDDYEGGRVPGEVFEDACFDFWLTDIMDSGLKIFEGLFPNARREGRCFIARYAFCIDGDDVEAGAKIDAQIVEQGVRIRHPGADVVEVAGQQDMTEVMESRSFGYDKNRIVQFPK